MLKVYIVLLDMDGCLFNVAYHKKATQQAIENARLRGGSSELPALCDVKFLPKEFIDCNELFFDHYLMQRAKLKANLNIIGLSTNRQSFFLDHYNGYPNPALEHPRYIGSCIPAIMAVESHLLKVITDKSPTLIDPYLLADRDNDRLTGYNFMEIVDLIFRSYPNDTSQANAFQEAANKKLDQCTTPFDELKCLLIQDRAYRAAKLHPGDEIVIEHVDDRKDILTALHKHFSQDPNRLPKRLTLRLCYYNGEEIMSFKSPIKGKGSIPDTIKEQSTCYTTSAEIEQKIKELRKSMTLSLEAIKRIVAHECWEQEGKAFCGTKLPRIIQAARVCCENDDLSNLIAFTKNRSKSSVGRIHGIFGTRSKMTADLYKLIFSLPEKDKLNPQIAHFFVENAKTFVEEYSMKFGHKLTFEDLLQERDTFSTTCTASGIKSLYDAAPESLTWWSTAPTSSGYDAAATADDVDAAVSRMANAR